MPDSGIQQLGLNFGQWNRKLRREKFVGAAPGGLVLPPAIKRLKTSSPEQDLTIEFAHHRWH